MSEALIVLTSVGIAVMALICVAIFIHNGIPWLHKKLKKRMYLKRCLRECRPFDHSRLELKDLMGVAKTVRGEELDRLVRRLVSRWNPPSRNKRVDNLAYHQQLANRPGQFIAYGAYDQMVLGGHTSVPHGNQISG